MNFEKIEDKRLNEVLYKGVHKSGLTVYVLPKKEHSKSYAAFATNYGSIDYRFIIPGEKEYTEIPDGVAHFLEHKLFEQPDGSNAFDSYSMTGANANAFTSFNSTVYLYSCTDKYYENLEILLDFVSNPYFTKENVDKEQGIIGQEIRMYDDDPGWRVFFNLLDCLYVNHPVKKDIAGTVESIGEIDKDLLYKCYNTFYNPTNMILFACGNVECDKIEELVDKYVTANPNTEIKRYLPEEPKAINKKYKEQKLSISTPLFQIGFKDTDVGYGGTKLLRKEIITSILLEILVGEGSDLYNTMYTEGLINDSFDADFEAEISYGFSSFSGESADPDKVLDTMLKAFSEIEFNEEEFERAKRVEIARYLRMWNSVEGVSNTMVSDLFKGINIFEYSDIVKNITLDDVKLRFKEHFDEKNCAMSVIKPYESNGDK
ncbi:MAG: pitrilysin family protein [Clostridia bacterium]|nr:pitrilysin family protein [Clostridia bacterium]